MSKVAIIGGGPTGFAVARALQKEPIKFDIHIFEKQKVPGGIWVYTGEGPIYRDLTSNIHKLLMQYEGYDFGDHIPKFIDRTDIYSYIERYSKDVESHDNVTVHWGKGVTDVTKKGKWQVTTSDNKVEEFDFVVVASGHYSTPFYPQIPGLKEFDSKGLVSHTKTYSSPERFKNKKILLIGNSASGVDVAIQLLSQTSNLLISRRADSPTDVVFDGIPKDEVEWKPEVKQINENGEVVFVDGSKAKVDEIVLATGYLYHLPFLANYQSQIAKPVHHVDLLDVNEQRVCNIHKFIFYIGDTSLAFVGLNKNISPLPFAESQGAAIARVWSNRLKLPSFEEMKREEDEFVKEKPGAEYLAMGYPIDTNYMASLSDWVDSAGPEGFFAERWDAEKLKLREVTHLAKIPTFKQRLEDSIAERKKQA